MTKIIVIGAVLIAVIAACFFVVNKIINGVLDGPGMENNAAFELIEYTKSVDEYGRSTSILVDEGKIKYYYNGGTVEESFSKECSYDEDFVLEMETIIRKYNLRQWSDLEKSDLEILDGSTTSLEVTFADNLVVSLGYGHKMTDEAWKAVREIVDLAKSYIESNAVETGIEINPADDNGLKIIVDYCESRVATNGADGYKEIILYKNETDNTYQLHTYQKEANEEEVHHAYTASKEIEVQVFDLIYQYNLLQYKDKQGIGLDGAVYIIKFIHGDDLVRVSTENLPENGADMLSSIGRILYSVIFESNEPSNIE